MEWFWSKRHIKSTHCRRHTCQTVYWQRHCTQKMHCIQIMHSTIGHIVHSASRIALSLCSLICSSIRSVVWFFTPIECVSVRVRCLGHMSWVTNNALWSSSHTVNAWRCSYSLTTPIPGVDFPLLTQHRPRNQSWAQNAAVQTSVVKSSLAVWWGKHVQVSATTDWRAEECIACTSQSDRHLLVFVSVFVSVSVFVHIFVTTASALLAQAGQTSSHWCATFLQLTSQPGQPRPDQTQCARKMQTSTLKIAPHTIDSRHSIERVPIKTVSDKRLVCTDKLQLNAVQGGLIWYVLCTNLQIGDICLI